MFVKDYKDYDGLNVAVRIRLKLVVPRYGSTWIERWSSWLEWWRGLTKKGRACLFHHCSLRRLLAHQIQTISLQPSLNTTTITFILLLLDVPLHRVIIDKDHVLESRSLGVHWLSFFIKDFIGWENGWIVLEQYLNGAWEEDIVHMLGVDGILQKLHSFLDRHFDLDWSGWNEVIFLVALDPPCV